jgi:hypothetical protein
MTANFLGLPLPLWGVICLLIAVVWVFVWPQDRAYPEQKVRYFIIRWFHALVWLFLAMAAFIAGFNIMGGGAAQPVAFLSLVTYLIFMAVFTTSRKVGRN